MPNTPFTQATPQIRSHAKSVVLTTSEVGIIVSDLIYQLTWDVRINNSEKNAVEAVLIHGQDFPRGDGNR
jgi:hypothetical protein